MGLSNTNTAEKNEYYSKLRMVTAQKEEINKLKSDINNMKDDVYEIKDLLRQLIEKG
jgi:predicted RNase H-like nuclease (RuvC/YqgF family)